MGDVMKEAAFSLAEAKFACGEFSQPVLQNVNKAQLKIRYRNMRFPTLIVKIISIICIGPAKITWPV